MASEDIVAEPQDLAEARRLITTLQEERRLLHAERQLLEEQLQRTRRENELLQEATWQGRRDKRGKIPPG